MSDCLRTVVVASGGLDSTVLAYKLFDGDQRLMLVSFDYGQRHGRELEAAAGIAATLGVPHELVDLASLGGLLAGSALTDSSVAVPDGPYTDASLATTVVPNRNAILLSVAVGIAAARGATRVAFGAHAGDHAVYPDCRAAFVTAFDRVARLGTDSATAEPVGVIAPFASWTKADIVALGAELGVPFRNTWSCYRGGSAHCGTCATCVERRDAFVLAGVPDSTPYLATASAR